jgi:glyoxylase-like metal-dependent hydrolase (beta-lactamase superfamily II)
MASTSVVTLDLKFQGQPHAIAAYLIRLGDANVLVESGPGSTLPALEAGLATEGLSPRDVTHVLLTHIHLDHAGAAGWLARQGAQIFVHRVGAPHMLDPERLIASATRIYGDRMETLWGEFMPVPQSQLIVPKDGEPLVIGKAEFMPLNTPGHAEHHYSYLFEDICFSGDVGGVRIPGYQYLRVPMPPPELHIERWHESIALLRKQKLRLIAPTHFGMFEDVAWHLDEVDRGLDSASRWLEETMPVAPPIEALRQSYTDWIMEEGKSTGLNEEVVRAYELANPLGMSADGLLRYWQRVRNAGEKN